MNRIVVSHQIPFPGFSEPRRRTREEMLLAFLRSKGYNLMSLAQRWNVHKTAPGKFLIKCSDPLPCDKREDLVKNLGIPENLLPPPPAPKEKKKKTPVFISPFDR